nr:DUF262 domain-containing protein [uncultured Brevundimonas sp.]
MSNTLFTKVDYTLSSLTDDISHGKLGLPDIQRPFVWKNVKVRDLFDSMYRGYPVGYLLFWETGVQPGTKQIGTDEKQLVPSRLIVDGQQRLTSLYAVIKGIPVVRDNFSTEKIEIAFNPLDEKFAVPDAAIRRDKRYIPNISAIWDSGTNLIEFSSDYIEGLKTQNEDITPDDVKRAQRALALREAHRRRRRGHSHGYRPRPLQRPHRKGQGRRWRHTFAETGEDRRRRRRLGVQTRDGRSAIRHRTDAEAGRASARRRRGDRVRP